MTNVLERATEAELTHLLERDYRGQLRWYPRPWREANGEALIGTLLDEADDTDRFTMEPGEWRQFATAGLAARLDRVIARRVRDAASTALLSAGTGIAVVSFVGSSWAPWTSSGPDGGRAFGPFFDAGPLLAVLWVLALGSALVGRWWIGRIALLVSLPVAALMRPMETLLAPTSFISLDQGTLVMSAAAAVLVTLGTPRTRRPFLAASVGWAAVACAALGLEELIDGGAVHQPMVLLLVDPVRTAWAVALVLGVAVVLALGRYPAGAGTIVIVVVPVTMAVLVQQLVVDPMGSPHSASLVVAPVVIGLAVLVAASRRQADRALRRPASGAPSAHAGRRSAVTVAIAATALVLGGSAGVLSASGLDWTRPAGVDWSRYWQLTASRPWAMWAQHPDASVTYRLPSGGSCTIRVAITDLTPTDAPSTAAVSARDYLVTGQERGALLADADVPRAIAANPSAQNEWTNFWGVAVRYGRGTGSYNQDVEYFEAVDAALRQSVFDRIAQAGGDPQDIFYSSMQRCVGEHR